MRQEAKSGLNHMGQKTLSGMLHMWPHAMRWCQGMCGSDQLMEGKTPAVTSLVRVFSKVQLLECFKPQRAVQQWIYTNFNQPLIMIFSHTGSMTPCLAALVSWSTTLIQAERSQPPLDGLLWNVFLIFMHLSRRFLLTLMIHWLFLWCHHEVHIFGFEWW